MHASVGLKAVGELWGDDPPTTGLWRFTAQNAFATMFFQKRTESQPPRRPAEGPSKILRALDPAGIRRDDRNVFAAHEWSKVVDEQIPGFQVLGANAKSVLKGRVIMHVHGHDAVDSHRFKQARHIARAAHADQRPRVVFAVFKLPLFVRAQRNAEMSADPLPPRMISWLLF